MKQGRFFKRERKERCKLIKSKQIWNKFVSIVWMNKFIFFHLKISFPLLVFVFLLSGSDPAAIAFLWPHVRSFLVSRLSLATFTSSDFVHSLLFIASSRSHPNLIASIFKQNDVDLNRYSLSQKLLVCFAQNSCYRFGSL